MPVTKPQRFGAGGGAAPAPTTEESAWDEQPHRCEDDSAAVAAPDGRWGWRSGTPGPLGGSPNVARTILYNFMDGACYSVWGALLLPVIIGRVAGDTVVGNAAAAAGVAQICAALVTGYFGDACRRQSFVRAGMACGLVGIACFMAAVYLSREADTATTGDDDDSLTTASSGSSSGSNVAADDGDGDGLLLGGARAHDRRVAVLFIAAQAVWGTYVGLVSTSAEALFADSVPSGQRARIYNVKWMVQTLCYLVGYTAALLMLLTLGNEWRLDNVKLVMMAGLAAHPLALATLATLKDRHALPDAAVVAVATVTVEDESRSLGTGGGGAGAGKDGEEEAEEEGEEGAFYFDCAGKPTTAQHRRAREGFRAVPTSDTGGSTTSGAESVEVCGFTPPVGGGPAAERNTTPATAHGWEGEDDDTQRVSQRLALLQRQQQTRQRRRSGQGGHAFAAEAAAAEEHQQHQHQQESDTPLTAASAVAASSTLDDLIEEELRMQEQRHEQRQQGRSSPLARVCYGGLHRLCSWPAVPFLVCLVDFLMALGSGMSLLYFPLFFQNAVGVRPAQMYAAYLMSTCLTAATSHLAQRVAELWLTRIPAVIAVRVVGTSFLLLMGLLPVYVDAAQQQRRGGATVIFLAIFVLRNACMNAVMGMTRSVIMDAVKKENRAKWSAFESVSSFTWAGSAAIGGYIVAAKGYQFNFFVTAMFHFAAVLLLIPAAIGARRVEAIIRERAAAAAAAAAE